MASYSTAESNLQASINTAASGGLVESYTSSEGNSARLGKAVDQIAALTRLEGLAARRASGGFLKVGRFVDPSL